MATVREEVLKLIQQKDSIEGEINELTDILTKNGVGMHEPLVDPEGFPTNSVDIYQVRHARHRIICLQNDHKALMKQIENGLQSYYGQQPSSSVLSPNVPHELQHIEVYKTPFAKIIMVSPGSPAEYCGICAEDLVIEFGSVNATNFRDITDIATVVQHSETQQVHIKLQRNDRFIVTKLIPRKWAGKGLLGCNIMPIK